MWSRGEVEHRPARVGDWFVVFIWTLEVSQAVHLPLSFTPSWERLFKNLTEADLGDVNLYADSFESEGLVPSAENQTPKVMCCVSRSA